jgi:hypothetical protein
MSVQQRSRKRCSRRSFLSAFTAALRRIHCDTLARWRAPLMGEVVINQRVCVCFLMNTHFV